MRWAESIGRFEAQEKNLVGDAMIASAFASYIGAFPTAYRDDLVFAKWIPDLAEKTIPMTEGITPLKVLANDADVASWNNEGLQTDTVSVQNGAIMMNAARWSLMIDPQLQAPPPSPPRPVPLLSEPARQARSTHCCRPL